MAYKITKKMISLLIRVMNILRRSIASLAPTQLPPKSVKLWARPHEGHDDHATTYHNLLEINHHDIIESAPGWREENASISEAVIKAERHSGDVKTLTELQKESASYFEKRTPKVDKQ